MSSPEIAELTGKRPDHVIKDVRKMLTELGKPGNSFLSRRVDAQGKLREHFLLVYHHTMCLLTDYKAELRTAVIERLDALERGEATPWHESDEPEPEYQIPQTYAEALRSVADETDYADTAELFLEDATDRLETATSCFFRERYISG